MISRWLGGFSESDLRGGQPGSIIGVNRAIECLSAVVGRHTIASFLGDLMRVLPIFGFDFESFLRG